MKIRMLAISIPVLIAALLVVDVSAGADPLLAPRTLRAIGAVRVGEVRPAFRVDFVGAVWSGSRLDEESAEVRFRTGPFWSAWQPLHEDGAEIIGQSATALVDGHGADAFEVRGLPAHAVVTALNTSDGPLVEVGRRPRNAASAATACRSRADWGADESIRKTTPPTYFAPQVLTLHHTADDGGDPTEPRDPAERMRAIYAFHVLDRGFDDIGYQYVIDEAGIVYEGRASGAASVSCVTAGGTGFDFGHEEAPTDGAVVGAHVGGQNSGNLGVALLGNYEMANPPAVQRSSAEQLLADLARRHAIDVTDLTYDFVNPTNGSRRTIPRLSGHRDWLATLCPGGMLYAALPDIRRTVSAMATTTTTTTTSTTTPPTTTTTRPPPTTTSPPPPTTTTTAAPPAPPARSGYWMVGSDGRVFAFGDAKDFGSAAVAGAVDLEPTPSGNGYWVVDRAGNVYDFGDATTNARPNLALVPNETVTSLSAAGRGLGYWLFTSRGRVISIDGAPLFGDMSGVRLNGPVLDSIPTPSGRGYYLVASDGGIFTFGDAVFHGSMGATPLNAPVQSLVPDGDGTGYWLVASDGGIFAFEAAFYGSMGDQRLNRPITGMVADGSAGYLMVAEDGGIFTFGTARFHGSLGDRPPAAPITSAATVRA